MKLLAISQGKFTLVDDADYLWLRKFRWWFDKGMGYAKTELDGKKVKLHRLLMPPRPGLEVDHINRDKLDNRRANLRYVTHGENGRNCLRKDNGTGFRGVSRSRTPGRWIARIKVDGYYRHLGTFASPEAAAKAYVDLLDVATNTPNQLPAHVRRLSSSGERCVYRCGKAFLVDFKRGGTHHCLGTFPSLRAAVEARNAYERNQP